MILRPIILSTAYLPPVQYFTKFLLGGEILVEDDENYIKQTYRNRCLIAGPNGLQFLTVPVERGSFHKIHIRDVRIDYQTRWQNIHRRALRAAYNSSPFYEYYIPELLEIISKKPAFLLDLNSRILEYLLSMLSIDKKISITGKFVHPGNDEFPDYRYLIHPKKKSADPLFTPVPYSQVFEEKFGFFQNLSIADLLFNTGPDAKQYLLKCIQPKKISN